MPPRRAFGTITPSSNRTVEACIAGLLRDRPGWEACVTRIPYWGNGLGQPADAYDVAAYAEAARLLGHAGVEVVCWNGTRGATLGLDHDRRLAEAMAAAAGVPATTTSLLMLERLRALGAGRVAILTQGEADYARAAGRNLGLEVLAAEGLGIHDNRLGAAVAPAMLEDALRRMLAAAPAGVEAALIWSTNLAGWSVAPGLTAELRLPVLDSAAVGVEGCLG